MKALFLVVALLATGVERLQAQVTSENIVGYINLAVRPGFNLIVNHLAADNEDLNTFMASVPDGTLVFRFDPFTQSYFDGVTFVQGFGWYPASGNIHDPVKGIPLGEGFFVHIPGSITTNITFVGEVLLHSTNHLPGNYCLKGSILPQAGTLVENLRFPPVDGDRVYQWDSVEQGFKWPSIYSVANLWQPEEPALAVGEGFLLFRNPALATPDRWWVRHFVIGPALVQPGLAAAAAVTIAPVIQHLAVADGQATLDINNPAGNTYDVQFSSDGITWNTVAEQQITAQCSVPFAGGPRGYFRLSNPH